MSRMATIDAFLNTGSKKGLANIILSDSVKLLFPRFACPTRVKNARQRMQTSMLSGVHAGVPRPRTSHAHFHVWYEPTGCSSSRR